MLTTDPVSSVPFGLREVSMKHKNLRLILSVLLILALLCGCSARGKALPVGSSASVPETEPTTIPETTEPQDTFSVTYNAVGKPVVHVPGPTDDRPAYSYTFNPHVCSSICRQALGDAVEAELYAFCDALLAGEDSFPCENDETWERVHAAMQEALPLSVLVSIGEEFEDDKLQDGRYPIDYSMDKAEFLEKASEFQTRIEELVAAADLREGDTDLERAIKLFHEESLRCVYDFETIIKFEAGEYQSNAYHTLTTDTGICQEFAGAYAYLLLQVGVDASVVASRMYDNDVHGWTILKIDDVWYNADVTWQLNQPYSLSFFGVTDDERSYHGVDLDWNDYGGYGMITHDDMQVTDQRFFYDFPSVQWFRIDHDKQQLIYFYDPDFDVENEDSYAAEETETFSLLP